MCEIVSISIGIHVDLQFSFSRHFISHFQPLVMQKSLSKSPTGIPRLRDRALLVCAWAFTTDSAKVVKYSAAIGSKMFGSSSECISRQKHEPKSSFLRAKDSLKY